MLLSRYAIRYHKPLLWRCSAFLFDTLGLPITWFHSKKIDKPKKILIIRKDEIGDLLLSIPMYEAIKKAYPNSELSVLVGKPAAPLLEHNPFIDRIIPIETIRNNKIAFIKQYLNLIRHLKNEKFDLAIDPKGSLLNIILMYLIRAEKRVAYWNISGGRPLLTHPVYYSKEMHDTDASLDLLRALGFNVKKTLPKLYFSRNDKEKAAKIIKKLPKKYCCAYMTPTKVYKGWPVEKWRALFASFPDMPFFIAAREAERTLLESEMRNLPNVKVLCTDSLKTLALIFAKAKAIVSIDGGMMHLAWISNPRIIELFGQVDLKLLYPQRGKVICYCPESEQGLNRQSIESNKLNKYMKMISVDEVASALRKYIK
jgi:ADP-heptose:LPS heptosyltransferase